MALGNPRGRNGGKVDVESLERENDQGLSMLSDHVSRLKMATVGIKNEAESQHRLLDNMDDGMTNTRGFLSSVNDKFRLVMNNKQGRQMTIVAGACVAILILFWWFTRK